MKKITIKNELLETEESNKMKIKNEFKDKNMKSKFKF